jgi:hypothetical protein
MATPKLIDPFESVHKKQIKGRGGDVVAEVDYIGWSQAADRLDAAAPSWTFTVLQLGDDWALGRLTIGERHFDNVGYAENADAEWKKEALKDAVSDAFKRCAALAGVARYLYDKDTRPAGRPQAAAESRPTLRSVPAEDEPPFPGMAEVARQEFDGLLVDESTCPDHNKSWRSNSKGYYCATKVGDGWCQRRPSAAWTAAHELVPA